ncbi:hypothetical protein EJB05_16918, partial [Eragrostis curvula]
MEKTKDSQVIMGGRYRLGRLLGRGNFAKVYKAHKVATGEAVAIKVFDKDAVRRSGTVAQVKREVDVMRRLRHPHVVRLHEVMATRSRIYFAMEYASGGELFARLTRSARFPEPVLLKRGYDGAKADIWSCGVILFVLMAGYLPFNETNMVCLYRKIMGSSYKCPPWFSVETRKLLARLLDPNPKTRITISKIKTHSWFQGPCALDDNPVVTSDTTVLLGKEACKDHHRHDDDEEEEDARRRKRSKVAVSSPTIAVTPSSMNAFDIISRSSGLDLSTMFDEDHRSEARFSTGESTAAIVSKLEEIAEARGFSVTAKEKGRVAMEGGQDGPRGALSVEAEIFEVAPSVRVVELRSTGGDSLEFREFYKQDLKPSLGDIVWSWQGGDSPPPPFATAATRRPTMDLC